MNIEQLQLKIKTFFFTVFICMITPAFAAVTWTVGSYVGNGTSLSITSLSFQPDVVLIKADAAQSAVIKTSTMASNASKQYTATAALLTTAITSLTSNGFTVGSSALANSAAVTYYFYAFKAGNSIKVGTYTGDGSANRNFVPTPNITTEFVFILPESSYGSTAIFTNASLGGGSAYDARGGGAGSVITNYAQPASPAFPAGGFWTKSANPPTNANTIIYHYVAFVANAGECYVSAYAGDGTDNRDLTGTGFKPNFLTITGSYNGEAVYSGGNVSTGNAQFMNAIANSTNAIQSFASNGFQVGSDNVVNRGGGFKMHYVAFGGASGGVLPIELLHFNAERITTKSIQVDWSTASEENNDYFTIERSMDGTEFETIGKVQGAENSITRMNYQFTDENAPTDKIAYYRLRQTDKDGMSRTFTVAAVSCTDNKKELRLAIAQNPITSNDLIYDLNLPDDATINVRIIDNLGNIASSQNYYYSRGSNRYSLDAGSLKTGVYILNVTDLTGNAKKSVRFVVNK